MKWLLQGIGKTLVLIVLVPLLLPVLLWIGLFRLTAAIYLRLWFWVNAYSKGKHIAFVYSNSPNWQEYIETNLLPKIKHSTYILNWSDRRNWTRTERLLLDHFFGTREYCPSAVAFLSFWRTKRIRMFKAFRDYKHGNKESLQRLESELLSLV